MYILVLFAFLAGLATIFAPCILPILPLVLSAGISGGKQRPLGIVTGLVISFTFFTLTLTYLTRSLGLNPNLLRDAAIIILLLFGLVLLIPNISTRFESWISSVLPQKQSTTKRTDFWGGVLVGLSLGLVWTPCVGPIVASVITLAATSSVNVISVLIIAAYALGTSIPLLVIIYGGQALLQKVKSLNKITPKLQIVFGAIMVLTALAMLLGIDQSIQANLLTKLPSTISTGLTQQLEESSFIQEQIQHLRGQNTTSSKSATTTISGLPLLGKAPEFTGIAHWLNSNALTIEQLKGKVVLIDFWTYSCINCIRTLPHVTSWYDTYKDQGLVIIGVHAPEFAFEKDTDNVAQAIEQFHIHYPVAQDNDLATWSAYNNLYWPAEYLIDTQGNIRATHFGEGKYNETEAHIRALLQEAKQNIVLPNSAPAVSDTTPVEQQSPETYLGTDRRENLVNKPEQELSLNQWNLTDKWQSAPQFISSEQIDSTLSYRFVGQDVYLVLNPPDMTHPAILQVMLDGKLITDDSNTDVHQGVIFVNQDRLYHLVHLAKNDGAHTLRLIFKTVGTKAFSFTFG